MPPRSTALKGGRGRKLSRGAAASSQTNNSNGNASQLPNQQQKQAPDDWHNGASPSCQRLARLVVHELDLGSQSHYPDQPHQNSTDNDSAAATAAPSSPAPGWPTLVRDYLLWGQRQTTFMASTTSSNSNSASAASKKKRKKKRKKSKKAASAVGDASTQSQEDEDDEDNDAAGAAETSSVGATSTTVSTADDVPSSTTAPAAITTDTGSTAEAATTDATNAASASAAATATATSKATAESSSSWHDQRWERRRLWVDQFLHAHRLQSSPPPPAAEEIHEKMDKFLTWLSTHPSHRVKASGGSGNNNNESSTRKQPATSDTDKVAVGETSTVALIPFEPAELVKQAVQSIECIKCRHHVVRILESPVVLSGTQEVVDDVAVSFQYHAMEEGNGKALPPFTLTLIPPDPQRQPASSASWRLQRNDGSPMVWTREVLDFWLQEYILLGGLGYDKIVMEPNGKFLTEKELQALRNGSPHTAAEMWEESMQCAQMLEQQMTNLQDIRLDKEDFIDIDMKSPPILFDTDSALSGILQRILRLVLKITHAYQRVATYHARVRSKTQVPILSSQLLANDKAMINLWDILLMAIHKILMLLSGLEEKLETLADGQGQIPHLYYNGHARKAFKTYVQDKLMVLHELLGKVTEAIDSDADTVETVTTVFHTSLVRSVYAMDDLLHVVVPHHDSLQRKTVLDEACEDILYILQEWSEHFRHVMLGQIIEEHETRRSRLAEAFDRADQILQMAKKDVAPASPDARMVESLYQSWKRRDLDTLTITGMSSLRQVREMIIAKTGAMIQLLLKIGKYRSVNPATYPAHLVSMPLHLIQWAATGKVPDPDDAVCTYGAQTRAGCLLSSLMFEWMAQRYSEWQAEVAGQELLVGLTGNEMTGGSTWSQVARGVKKSTKKKAAPSPGPKPATPATNVTTNAEVTVEVNEDDTSDDDEVLLASMVKGKASLAPAPLETVKKTVAPSLVEKDARKIPENACESKFDDKTQNTTESAPLIEDNGNDSKVDDIPEEEQKKTNAEKKSQEPGPGSSCY